MNNQEKICGSIRESVEFMIKKSNWCRAWIRGMYDEVERCERQAGNNGYCDYHILETIKLKGEK